MIKNISLILLFSSFTVNATALTEKQCKALLDGTISTKTSLIKMGPPVTTVEVVEAIKNDLIKIDKLKEQYKTNCDVVIRIPELKDTIEAQSKVMDFIKNN